MENELKQLLEEAKGLLSDIKDKVKLEELKTEFLGRKGKMGKLMKDMATLSDEQRKVIGKLANEVKQGLEEVFEGKTKEVEQEAEKERIAAEWIDITEPGNWQKVGHLHPISSAIAEISEIFSRIGFSRTIAPEIDWDFYAFESLNMPKTHPARDDWETFFINHEEGKKGKIVLTPHTSNSQVRELEKGELPLRMININRNYRRQSDVTHSPMFHQFEGFMVAKGLTVANLRGVIEFFVHQYFGKERKIRLRPHHFRFTEPSFEVDISCDTCGADESISCRVCKGGWLELGGAGMTHPNVLKAGGIDPNEYQAFAFGFGIERTMMMREGTSIDDIRVLYRNDMNFVKQF